ncbi:flavoprotein [Melioribacter roseus P3M-2]|uniref:Coenzyme A biosynthesis bifunctional protein CoaBC n=1 Tax=Melioribacter roseus (strain DSM 23840 / JCM 17771 / VKM B-2668 / P3M-2) TaxID=1191523 RepID=I6Z794_MELRP|nr:bifunctional phosphopantothenoylcysteine decarboxylase/phosphopantothenate--cysteine ligase CoaBC [Melioribacter roseus]AFN75030.1 flavoprotein [Melioribacter roseus P3M-2]
MLKSKKILLGITGSIAAYKSLYLISRLVQNGCDVKVVTTKSALQFVGNASIEGLTGNRVYNDLFDPGTVMSHINLIKWCDLFIIAPATANVINKIASGIADDLPTSLALARDNSTPFLVAPAMNTNMYFNPATQASIKKLIEFGADVLPTAEGYLACGDEGAGKLLEPEIIFNVVKAKLLKKEKAKRKLKILITAGGTKENIDGVRYITNLSTGKTASELANYFFARGHAVDYLSAEDAMRPGMVNNIYRFADFESLDNRMKLLLGKNDYDVVVHNAAVSDFSPALMTAGNIKLDLPSNKKISSGVENVSIILKRNHKILARIREYSSKKEITVVGFKFTNTMNKEERKEAVKKLLTESNCDLVVQNDLSDRTNGVQRNFYLYDKNGIINSSEDPFSLAMQLENYFESNRRDEK